MFRLQRVGSHGSIMSKIKTFKRLRVTREGGFVARKVRNYNRRNPDSIPTLVQCWFNVVHYNGPWPAYNLGPV